MAPRRALVHPRLSQAEAWPPDHGAIGSGLGAALLPDGGRGTRRRATRAACSKQGGDEWRVRIHTVEVTRRGRSRALSLGGVSWSPGRVARILAQAAVVCALAVLPLGVSDSAWGLDVRAQTPTSPASGPTDAPRLKGMPALPKPPQGFNTYDGGWITFAYPPGLRERVQTLIHQAAEARADLGARLGKPVLDRVTVYVARSPGEMASLAPEGAPFPKYAAGVAYSELGLVLLTLAPVYPASKHDMSEVFRHELSHLALADALGEGRVPRWFNEGFAVFASGESSFARLRTLWIAALGDDLLSLHEMQRSFPADAPTASIAYAQAADVVRFLVRHQERHRFDRLISLLRDGRPFETAIEHAYGTDLATLEYEWREDVAKRYTFWPILFSGSTLWIGALGLFVWGYRRRRQRHHQTLQRWAREEAIEDRLNAQRAQAVVAPASPVHIVFSRPQPKQIVPPLPAPPDVEVPKIEHDGRWHTVH